VHIQMYQKRITKTEFVHNSEQKHTWYWHKPQSCPKLEK
jgi:hypothetical protein